MAIGGRAGDIGIAIVLGAVVDTGPTRSKRTVGGRTRGGSLETVGVRQFFKRDTLCVERTHSGATHTLATVNRYGNGVVGVGGKTREGYTGRVGSDSLDTVVRQAVAHIGHIPAGSSAILGPRKGGRGGSGVSGKVAHTRAGGSVGAGDINCETAVDNRAVGVENNGDGTIRRGIGAECLSG